MKLIHKKLLVGTMAAGLLIGGGLVLQHNQVFADETGTATPAPKKDTLKDRNHKSSEGRVSAKGSFEIGKGGALDFASILGIEQSVLKEEIKQGKTLVQIAQDKANLSEEALLNKLTEAETKKIDEALTAGKIKQQQADKLKSSLAERLKKIVEAKPKAIEFKGAPGPRGGSKPGGIWGDPHKIAVVLGITDEELSTQRKTGKSLAEIAQDKGITEDQLIAKLKDSLTDELKSFVERKGGVHPTKPQHDGPKFKGKPSTTATPTPTPQQ
ncbi:hypothetical protein SAMN04487897_102822 [Paenibacillus sp. yr247]|uniref:hypothetical protein n=1 Tax=Paenibacillus sp. yr247 TaxID=1761880 RepID=UPI00088977A2|nr:hypothetical protein [Paenibacillus sp. yr247]SDN41006.1 hypothetical protein SAMN04487897_102822 [Paenibacillus sp. yr247]